MKYKPGETVPQSGIYAEVHTAYQKNIMELTFIKGEYFPPCNGRGYHYELIKAAMHKPTGA
ncbi:MAG: YjzC family protein [Chitinophagales bacterium]|nr:YjzC family protein [Chitinophagales bacterium]